MLRIRTLKTEAAERLAPARTSVRGEWVGDGARALGLEGRVRRADLVALLGGEHPRTGERLCRARRVVGLDVMLGAPKGVSLLHAFAGPRAAREVSEGLLGAAAGALGYLERSAAFVRRGAAGARVLRADGVICVARLGEVSDAGDPHVRVHLLVLNLARGPDGRHSALDARPLYAHGKTAGFLFQAHLRHELGSRLGLGWCPVRAGTGEVAGLAPDVLRAFSCRRQMILAELALEGRAGPRASRAAAVRTLGPRRPRVADQRAEWRARLVALGVREAEIRAVLGLAGDEASDAVDLIPARAGLDLAALAERTGGFSRRDLLQALCERATTGATVEAIEREADQVLADRDVVLSLGVRLARRDIILRRDGRALAGAREEARYRISVG